VRPVGLRLAWHRHGGGLPDGQPCTIAVAGRQQPGVLPAGIPAGHTLALGCDRLDGHASLLEDTVTDLAATRRPRTDPTVPDAPHQEGQRRAIHRHRPRPPRRPHPRPAHVPAR